MENSIFREQSSAIADFAGIFMSGQFGFRPQPVKVLMDTDWVVIRLDNFLCPAEQEMGIKNSSLIQEMYSQIFRKVKSILEDRVHQITCKMVSSSQININFETKKCVIILFLTTRLTHSGDEADAQNTTYSRYKKV